MKNLITLFILTFSLQGFGAITITPSTVPNGYNQHAYSVGLTATGGAKPYTWLVYGGSLPNGLTLLSSTNNTASIAGIPSVNGVFSFSVSVTDKNGTVARIHYRDTISYNLLSVPEMTTLWSRSVPTPPYGFDTWNSLVNNPSIGLALDGVGSSTVTGTFPSYTVSTPLITFGTYTPTVTSVSNLSAVTAGRTIYQRIGNTVNVSGFITATTLDAPNNVRYYISLPVASTFTQAQDASGVVNAWGGAGRNLTGFMEADASTHTGTGYLYSDTNIVNQINFNFSYVIK